MSDIEIKIILDESSVDDGIKSIEANLSSLDKTTTKTQDSIQKGFDEGAKSIEELDSQLSSAASSASQLSKENNKNSKETKRLANENKNLAKSYLRVSRQLRAFRTLALGGFTAIISGIGSAIEGITSFVQSFDPAIQQQKQLTEATQEVAGSFARELIEVKELLRVQSDNTQSTEKQEQAVKTLTDRYGDLIGNLQDSSGRIQDVAKAQEILTNRIIDQTRAQIVNNLFQQYTDELGKALVEQANIQQQAEEASESTLAKQTEFFGDFLRVASDGAIDLNTNFANVIGTVGSLDSGKRIEAATKGIENLDKVSKQLDPILKQVSGTILQINTSGFDPLATATTETPKKAAFIQGSLAELRAEYQKLQDQIQKGTAIGDIDTLSKLVEDSAQIQKAIEAAEKEIKRLRGELIEVDEEALAETLRIRLGFIESEKDAAIRAARESSKDRLKQIEKQIEDEDLLEQLRKENLEKLNRDIAEINKRFAEQESEENKKTQQEQLTQQQATLEQEIALREAELRAIQAADNKELLQRGATEEEVTEQQRQQEIARQRLTLESERKRLELIQKFATGRTQAEIDATKALIKAIDAELATLGQSTTEAAEQRGGSGNLIADILGLDPSSPQFQALEQGFQAAKGLIDDLLSTQLEAIDAEIQARDNRISSLNTQLQNEIKLRELGLASNVQATQEALAQEEKLRREALEKERKIQQAQAAVQTIQQATNLATASAQIFSSLAAAGPVGVGIAVATIAAMIASFVASKAQAAKAAKLEQGGKLEGPSHAKGGVPVYFKGHHHSDNNAYEAEGGEWVVNKVDSADQDQFIKRLNNGEFRGRDLNKIIDYGAKSKSLKVTVNKHEKHQSELRVNELQKAISKLEKSNKEGLSNVSNRIDKLHEKPSRQYTDDGYIETIIKTNGSVRTRKVRIKQ